MPKLKLITAFAFWFLNSEIAFAQDMAILGGNVATGVSIGFEQLKLSEPGDYPGLTLEEQKLSLNAALFSDQNASFSLTGRGERTKLGKVLTMPVSKTALPEEFGTAEGGFSFVHENTNGDKFGLSASYGSAGTRLLDNGYSPILNANISYEDVITNGRAWTYFISYSNNRATLNNIPIPGIAYSLSGQTYKMLLGLPFFFISWRPDPLSFSLLISPFAASSEIGFRIWGPIQFFAAAAWAPKSYQNLVAGSETRLIFDRKELTGGIRLFLGRDISLSGFYVHSFNRKFLLGKSITDNSESLAIADAFGIGAKLRLAF